jgi:hypothetical protein
MSEDIEFRKMLQEFFRTKAEHPKSIRCKLGVHGEQPFNWGTWCRRCGLIQFISRQK